MGGEQAPVEHDNGEGEGGRESEGRSKSTRWLDQKVQDHSERGQKSYFCEADGNAS